MACEPVECPDPPLDPEKIGPTNYNAGVPFLKVIADADCPFQRSKVISHSYAFHSTGIEAVAGAGGQNTGGSEGGLDKNLENRGLSHTPGLSGLFPKPSYVEVSTYLLTPGKDDIVKERGGTSTTGSASAKDNIKTEIELGLPGAVMNYWIEERSPLAGRSNLEQFVWKHEIGAGLAHAGSDKKNPTKTNNASGAATGGAQQSSNLSTAASESNQNSNNGEKRNLICYPEQTSIYTPTVGGRNRYHWRVKQISPLQRGFDFFVDLKTSAERESNFDKFKVDTSSPTYRDYVHLYRTLGIIDSPSKNDDTNQGEDENNKEGGKGNDGNSSQSNNPNQTAEDGAVDDSRCRKPEPEGENAKTNKSNNRGGGTSDGGNDANASGTDAPIPDGGSGDGSSPDAGNTQNGNPDKVKLSEDYAGFFKDGNALDPNVQPYYMIEIRSDRSHADESLKLGSNDEREPEQDDNEGEMRQYLYIPKAYHPIFLSYKKDSNGEWALHQLRVWTDVKGEEIFKKKYTRVKFRNHLTNLVITLGEDDKNPWIIPFAGTVGDENEVHIHGGNIAVSFALGMVKYQEETTFQYPFYGNITLSGDQKRLSVNCSVDQVDQPRNNVTRTGGDGKIALVRDCDAGIITEYIRGNQVTFDEREGSETRYLAKWKLRGSEGAEQFTPGEIKFSELDRTCGDPFSVDFKVTMNAGEYYVPMPPDINAFFNNFDQEVNPPTGVFLAGTAAPILNNINLSTGNPIGGRGGNQSFGQNFGNQFAYRPVDISDYVVEYSDTWSASDFHKIEHTGTLRLIIKPDPNTKGNCGLNKASLASFVASLSRRACYMTIDVSNFCSINTSDGTFLRRIPDQNGRLFTGIAYGGTITREPGKIYLDLKLMDYSKVMQDQYYFDSPWYDGVYDVALAHDIMTRCGFKFGNSGSVGFGGGGNEPPGRIVRQAFKEAIAGQTKAAVSYKDADGSSEVANIDFWAMPQSANILREPFVRFSEGQSYYDAMYDIAQRGGKVMYFDHYGVFHYENKAFDAKFFGGKKISPKFRFSTRPFSFGKLILNQINVEYDMESVFNHIKVATGTPQGFPVMAESTYYPGFQSTYATGFLGYEKLFFQREGVLSSLDAARKSVQVYKKFFKPPIIVKFETYGILMKALDVFSVEGIKSDFVATNVTHKITRDPNQWWMTVEGEWYSEAPTTGVVDNNGLL